MDTEKVYTTSLRLYKSRPVHHQAYQNDKTPVIEVVKEIQNKKIPETPGTVKPGPKTGDDTNWFLPLLALGVSAGMVAGLLYYRKRHKKA